MKALRTGSVVIILLVVAVSVSATVPPIINYQGKLIQPSGEPFSDGTYSVTFSIYGVPNGGVAVWTETNGAVQLKGGLFSVLLGSISPMDPTVFAASDRWLGIKIGEATEMVPRQKIASVAYAQTSADGNPPGSIIMFAGTAAPEGWLLCKGQAISRADYPALFAVIGTTYGAGDGSTTFNLPNMEGRFPMGAAGPYPMGATGGSTTKNLQHSHTTATHALTIDEMPAHDHREKVADHSGYTGTDGTAAGTGYTSDMHLSSYTSVTGGGTAHSHGNTGTGLATTQDVMNPYISTNFIIKY